MISSAGPNVIKVLRVGGAATARICIVEYQGRMALLKDYAGNSWFFRNTLGSYLTRRELKAYSKIKGIRSIPRLYAAIARDGLLLEFLKGRNCAEIPSGDFSPSFFTELNEILDAVRGRGVLHGDLRRNILVSSAGRPLLLDFGASFVVPCWLSPLKNLIGNLGARYDQKAVLDLKASVAPHLVTAQDAQLFDKRLPLEEMVHLIQRCLNKFTKWFTFVKD